MCCALLGSSRPGKGFLLSGKLPGSEGTDRSGRVSKQKTFLVLVWLAVLGHTNQCVETRTMGIRKRFLCSFF